jgi:hypothetical protein
MNVARSASAVAHGSGRRGRCRAARGGGVGCTTWGYARGAGWRGLRLHPEAARLVVVAGVKLGAGTDDLATGVMATRGSGWREAWGGSVCVGSGGRGCVKQ